MSPPASNPGPLCLAGQCALVTGGGIGRAIALALAVDGGTWASSGWVRDRAGEWALAEPYPEIED